MGIKAVAFDFGNVISAPQDPQVFGLLAAIAEVSEAEAKDIVFNGRDDWDRGDMDGPSHYKRGFARLGREADEGTMQAFLRTDLESWAALNQETVKLIAEVKTAGAKTAVLSNMPHEFAALAKKRFPVISSVDVCILSCEHSVVKPDRGIFDILLARLGLEASEIVFFDDLETNVAAGRSVGIQAILWKDADGAKKALIDLGVLK